MLFRIVLSCFVLKGVLCHVCVVLLCVGVCVALLRCRVWDLCGCVVCVCWMWLFCLRGCVCVCVVVWCVFCVCWG